MYQSLYNFVLIEKELLVIASHPQQLSVLNELFVCHIDFH